MLEWDIVHETGWTFEELDRQDSTRVIPALRAANIRAALYRVLSVMNATPQQITAFAEGGLPIDPADMKIWGETMQIRDEIKRQNG